MHGLKFMYHLSIPTLPTACFRKFISTQHEILVLKLVEWDEKKVSFLLNVYDNKFSIRYLISHGHESTGMSDRQSKNR